MRTKPTEVTGGDSISWFQKSVLLFRSTHFAPCIGVTMFTVIMAGLIGYSASKLLTLVPTVLLGQFSIGWLNDYLDRERDALVGRRDKPVALGLVSEQLLTVCVIVSFAASITLGFTFGTRAGVVYLIAMLSALLYDIYLKFTVGSIISLIVSFGLLPVFVSLGSPSARYPHAWMIVAAAFLGATIHFLNVIPDFDDDAKTGVKGFVHYFSYRHALLLGGILLIYSVAAVGWGIRDIADIFSWVTVVVFALLGGWFMRQYMKGNIKSAFNASKLLTLANIAVLFSVSRYM